MMLSKYSFCSNGAAAQAGSASETFVIRFNEQAKE
jgi:hypothetical protein